MPLDGIVVRNIVDELNEKIIGGKIDRIAQPEIDEIILSIRKNRENYKLLLSSSPVYPRVNLTVEQKQGPVSAPMFCMVLRKHISGGKIVRIEQYNIDRVIKIYIEGYDELGELSNRILICEIMGRHSNIILANEKTGEIIDSVRHITPDMSSFRQVLPGIKYVYPPAQDKISPLNFDGKNLLERLTESSNTRLGKFIARSLDGINIFAAREICFNAGLDENMIPADLDAVSKDNLISSILKFSADVADRKFAPCIYFEGDDPFDFYSLNFNYLSGLSRKAMPSISETIETFYFRKDKKDRLKQKSSDIRKIINNNLERCYKKLSIQVEKLSECSGKDRWRLFGDLVMANIYNIKKGDSEAKLVNFYDENSSVITIPLNENLKPSENAQKFYKTYNKEKSAEKAVMLQKEENTSEIEYLETQLVNIENCTEDIEIDEIRNELTSLGYIRARKKAARIKQKRSKPMHYISSDGFDIYAGKNNVQNDYLTTKFAEPYDIWLHTKKIPGSHVIIKCNRKKVSDTALFEGASLASYFSKARGSSNVPVDYTEKKNVKKPSGAKPGMVVYYTNSTIYVTPDPKLISSLKGDTGNSPCAL